MTRREMPMKLVITEKTQRGPEHRRRDRGDRPAGGLLAGQWLPGVLVYRASGVLCRRRNVRRAFQEVAL